MTTATLPTATPAPTATPPENPAAPATTTLTVTPKAFREIAKLMRTKAPDGSAGLRIGIRGGGCSGLSYFMEWEKKIRARDVVLEGEDGGKVIVDPKSALMLKDTTFDYLGGLNAKFLFQNPHSKRECGCGESFAL